LEKKECFQRGKIRRAGAACYFSIVLFPPPPLLQLPIKNLATPTFPWSSIWLVAQGAHHGHLTPKSPAGTPRRDGSLPAGCCEQREMVEGGKASFALPLCEIVAAFWAKPS